MKAILVSKGLYNFFHKQNNTWLLVDIEFLFFSFVQRDISLFHCVHSEDIELNTQREIPHQRTPMLSILYSITVSLLFSL